MCGRYYVDDDTAREIEKMIRQVDEKIQKAESIHLQTEDIHPSEVAPVITADYNDLCYRWKRWGSPGFSGKQFIFNARSESALEKKMFKESAEHRRVVVPSTWFYEWNKYKEKNIFYREGQPVHDRMLLLLEQDEIEKWLFKDDLTEAFLQKTPALLERRADYEQMSLFPVENS